MGSGIWSANIYDECNRQRAAKNQSAFDYSDRVSRSGRSDWKAHERLNPYGVKQRESRDSAEHPDATAIAVLFDVTGSMREVPKIMQTRLPQLLGLLQRKAYVPDPQILFGAIGDATCDRVPLQIGQFESDNRMDENLEAIFLEGGGGGQRTESYELAMYFLARHTDIDDWNKRGRRGYAFIIGDEMAYPTVKSSEVRDWIGDTLSEDIRVEAIVQELRRHYHVFYLLPNAASYGGDREILGFWRALLGKNVLELEDAHAVCEVIALTIGMTEGQIDLSHGTAHLREAGVDERTLQHVSRALAKLPAGETADKVSSTGHVGMLSKLAGTRRGPRRV
jgi:hypothetical protein